MEREMKRVIGARVADVMHETRCLIARRCLHHKAHNPPGSVLCQLY